MGNASHEHGDAASGSQTCPAVISAQVPSAQSYKKNDQRIFLIHGMRTKNIFDSWNENVCERKNIVF